MTQETEVAPTSAATQATFGAAILANGGADALAQQHGAPHKALIDLNGRPMLDYVLEPLMSCDALDRVMVVAHETGAAPHIGSGVPLVTPEGDGFNDAILAAAEATADFDYLLICTCDVPMLTTDAVEHFVATCRNSPGADLAYGIVKEEVVQSAYPDTIRTTVDLVEGSFVSGCFGAMTRRFLDNNMDRLQAAFAARKSKIALGRLLGWGFVGKLLLRRLSLVSIVQRAEQLLGCETLVVISPHAEIALDVDKADDLELARQWAAGL
jgi:molybdopterin-guanine dinucleotide biosynthesis protein A